MYLDPYSNEGRPLLWEDPLELTITVDLVSHRDDFVISPTCSGQQAHFAGVAHSIALTLTLNTQLTLTLTLTLYFSSADVMHTTL